MFSGTFRAFFKLDVRIVSNLHILLAFMRLTPAEYSKCGTTKVLNNLIFITKVFSLVGILLIYLTAAATFYFMSIS